jgi:ribose transport system substrate-binding protein
MRMKHTKKIALAVSVTITVTATAGQASGGTEPAPPTSDGQAAPSLEFVGPNGEVPTPAEELVLTDEEIDAVRSGGYTAAFVWHENSPFIQAVESGATRMFEELGIEVVASTTAEFDAARQAANVESTLALEPDIIVTIPVDPVLAAEAFRPAVDSGVKLVILTVPPAGYVHGEDFVGIVTTNVPEYGQFAAQMLGDALQGQGNVGWIFHDAEFWITNMRDQAFKDWLEYLYPDTEVVAEEGFTDPARTGELASAMLTRNPDLDGIYVAWATAAAGVLESLRTEGRTDTRVVTNDLEAPLAIDMCQGGNVVGVVANPAVMVGERLGVMSAYGVLDKPAPEMAVVPPLAVTSENVAEGWQTEFGEDPPAEVREVCGIE